MEYLECEWEHIKPYMFRKRKQVRQFLHSQGLQFEEDCEFTLVAKVPGSDEILCTGSLAGKVLKCIAVKKDCEGMGFAASLVSELMLHAVYNGNTHLFLFTSPNNKHLFNNLRFFQIAEAENEAILMENRQGGLEYFLNSLEGQQYKQKDKVIGSIVVNCNPFTNGHRSIIEYASKNCDILHIFVVMEDRSQFPAEDRYNLVRQSTEDLTNIFVHPAKDYIISQATFPTYFLKQDSDTARVHARLDLDLFCRHIAPHLGINKRFAGEEPLCKLTSTYNEEMRRILPLHGIEFVTIPRITSGGTIISASHIRELLAQGKLEETAKLVPPSTYEYLRRMTK